MHPEPEEKPAAEESEDLPLLFEQEKQLENRASEPDYFEDTDSMEFDEDDDDFSELFEVDISKNSDSLLLEQTSSESSFVDIGESTRPTFPDTGLPRSSLSSDDEMLLSHDGGGRQEGVVLWLGQQDEIQRFEGDQMLCE
ncbi:uncharacterized protein PFLUO_LOCUS8152 [Penicillium psychrofluorescens]|uniref:uncharacterized protein n=1 Tax=Penicillium psychrofluorescens TaxID=3158075 RepID=UPI003CCDD9BB